LSAAKIADDDARLSGEPKGIAMSINLSSGSELLHLTKVDVARRQLKTAIRLWFHDADPVSIHTLAFAAYEIIHVVSKKRNRTKALVFDTLSVKEEHRSKWNKTIKEHAGFFKHANNDADKSIDFNPTLTMMFLMGAVAGLKVMQETKPGEEESALAFWIVLHRQSWVTAKAREVFQSRIAVEDLDAFKVLPKLEFFKAFTSKTRP
jgi:hypothetical protein